MRKSSCGDLEELLLRSLLDLSNEAKASDIRKNLNDRSKRDVAMGSFYVVLDALVRKDLIEVVRVEDAPKALGGRPLRIFRVSNAGIDAVRNKERERRAFGGSYVEGLA